MKNLNMISSSPNQVPPTAGKLLLADDDELCREGLAALLRRAGYECHGAADGPGVLRALRETSFDALLCDIHMPGNTDLEVVQSIPQVAAGLPVILLTGKPSIETAAKSVGLSVVAYLVKPPRIEELRCLLAQSIEAYRRLQSLASHRQRLQDWDHELKQIEALWRSRTGNAPAAMATLLTVSWRNLLAALADVKSLTELLNGQIPQATLQELERARPLVLVEAIRETICILEKTKSVYRSKELAELRRKLESLVNAPQPNSVQATSADLQQTG